MPEKKKTLTKRKTLSTTEVADVLGTRKVAEVLGVSVPRVNQLVNKGQLKAYRTDTPRREWRVKTSDLKKFIKEEITNATKRATKKASRRAKRFRDITNSPFTI